MTSLKESKYLSLPFPVIEAATKNFTTLIGKGGYGHVYKGELSLSGELTTVAVKRLNAKNSKDGQGLKEFLTEIQLLSRLKHPNLVSLLGFCDQGDEKILIYEYAEHGSLDKYLGEACTFTWKQRINICIDAACGLNHLHNHVAVNHRVIHRDIKSGNILLDHNWRAMIADLGFSKIGLLNENNSYVVSHPCGTEGYLDPEYMRTGILTKESDIYSFGVVLFEVLCGRLSYMNVNDDRRFLAELARSNYKENKLKEIIDPSLKNQFDSNSIYTFSKIAYECLLIDRQERPAIATVVQRLKDALKFQDNVDKGLELTNYKGINETSYSPMVKLSANPSKEVLINRDSVIMEADLIMISEITRPKFKFALKVKVLRMWNQKGFQKLIIMDEQGHKIGATVRSMQRPKFQDVLMEDGYYIIRDVVVVENRKKSIHWSHEYKLIFSYKTTVKVANKWNGPLNGFNLIPFSYIVSRSVNINVSVDVIGRIVKIGDIKPFDNGEGKTSTKINVDLQDLNGIKITCTFWGKFADQVYDYVSHKEPRRCVIVILRFTKTKDYLGRLTVQTDWNATKVFMNTSEPEITDFRSRLVAFYGDDQPIESLAPAITPSNVTPKAFFEGCNHIELDEISPSMVGQYVVYATINSIIPDDDWCYIACRKCKKGMYKVDDLTLSIDAKLALAYVCTKCGPNPKVYLRFKVQIRVVNERGSASFTLFESELKSMITKTAYEIRKSMGDDDDIRDELNEIVGRKMLFKISVTDFNKVNSYPVYTVSGYRDDEQHIKLFKEEYGFNEDKASDNVGSSQLNSSTKDAASITGDNSSTVNLTVSTGESPARKRKKHESETTPLSVQPSSLKAKKSMLSIKSEKP